MLLSYIVYITLLSTMIYFSSLYSKKKQSSGLFFVPIFIFTLIFGMRYGVGIDYLAYLDMYMNWRISDQYMEHLEPGFKLLMDLFSYFQLHYVFLFSLFAFIQIFFLFLSFKKDKEVLPFICLTLIATGLASGGFMNVIRQSIAFCIFLYSTKFILNKSFPHFIFYILIAASFHKTALILIPLYFISTHNLKFSIKLQYFILLFALIVMQFDFISDWLKMVDKFVILIGYGHYLDMDSRVFFESSDRNLGLMDLLYIIFLIICIFNYYKVRKFFNSSTFNYLYPLFFIGLVASFLFKGSMLFERFFLYFINLNVIIPAYFLYYFYQNHHNNKNNYFRYFYSIMLYILFFFRIMIYSAETTTQYVFFFQENLHQMKEEQLDNLFNRRQ